jgi:hypothetical protein
VDLADPDSAKGRYFLAEGRCEGRIVGWFRGASHPHRRSDETFLPDFQGVIETDDGTGSSLIRRRRRFRAPLSSGDDFPC